MPALAMILPLLKQYWLPIALGCAALLLAGYIKVLHVERDHYKNEVVQLKTQIAEANHQREELEASATEITKKYHESLKNQFELATKQAAVTQKRIANDKETASIHLSPNAVSLFNSSKPEANVGITANPKPADDGGPGSDQKTLNQLLQISAENDSNHALCIATVRDWQSFWSDYSTQYGAVVHASP